MSFLERFKICTYYLGVLITLKRHRFVSKMSFLDPSVPQLEISNELWNLVSEVLEVSRSSDLKKDLLDKKFAIFKPPFYTESIGLLSWEYRSWRVFFRIILFRKKCRKLFLLQQIVREPCQDKIYIKAFNKACSLVPTA